MMLRLSLNQPYLKRCLQTALCLSLLWLSGCTTPTYTQPARTGIEQLLLSTAVDRALEGINLPQVDGRRVYLDNTYLKPYDAHYVEGTIRNLISNNGALLVAEREQADIIVEARDGALGIDPAESLFGVPALSIPVPLSGTFQTPELALYSSHKQNAVTKLALLAYDNTGRQVFSTENKVGKAYFHNYSILLFIDLNFTDIPEREDY